MLAGTSEVKFKLFIMCINGDKNFRREADLTRG